MTGAICPHCGGALPAEAQFCKHCGEAVELSCHNCGESVPAQANYCPSCRAELRTTPDSSGGAGTDDGALRLQPREFARRIEQSELGGDGFLAWLNRRKAVEIETGNRALLLENGAHVDSLRPGRHTLESLTKRITNLERKKDLTVVLVEDGDTAVDIAVGDLRTASEFLVTVYVELVIAVDDSERFVRSMLADRSAVTAGTFSDILGDAIRDELQATIKEYERDELYGNRELKRDLRQDIERHCRATLERYGLDLVELRSFDYDDDRDDIREGRKEVSIREEKEDIKDQRARLGRRERERKTDDKVHERGEWVRDWTSWQSAKHEKETHASELEHEQDKQEIEQDHEIEKQETKQDHEIDDIERRQGYRERVEDQEIDHELEREEMDHDYDRMDHERDRTDHDEQVKTRKKEGNVERRDLEHEQDTKEIEDLMDLKKKKDLDKLDVREREEDIEMDREEHQVEMEKERLQARDEVDVDTLASLADAEDPVAELAKMEKAGDLTPEQLDALGAQESDELAKARQEAKKAEHERERLEDQEAFREEVREMADDAMDRMQETSESAMDNVAETGKAAAEDTSDNVFVSDSGSGSSDGGDTTIVQGGDSGGGGGGDDGTERVLVCPNCDAEIPADDEFCMQCGTEV